MTLNSTKDVLVIPGEVIDFDELVGAILNHFGVDADPSNFKITSQNVSLSHSQRLLWECDTKLFFFIEKRRS